MQAAAQAISALSFWPYCEGWWRCCGWRGASSALGGGYRDGDGDCNEASHGEAREQHQKHPW